MQYFKISAAGKIAEAAHELSADVCLTPEDILTMLEYPPDSSMGDIAFPCFRLSKTLRNAPPKIAAVSYTHLDVYKRQAYFSGAGNTV